MAQPTGYDRQYNFENFAATSPTDPLPGVQVDTEFNALKVSMDETQANLALIQRDDGLLANQSVGRDQLAPSLSLGFNAPENWVTATVYTDEDTCFYDGEFYNCLLDHTAGVFATDLAAGRWQKVTDFASAITSGVNDGLAELPGGNSATELTIASGIAAPTRATHTLAAEAGTTDTLNELSVASMDDGRWLMLSPASGDTITVAHNAGGATNPIICPDGADLVLDGTTDYLLLRRSGTQWLVMGLLNQPTSNGARRWCGTAGGTADALTLSPTPAVGSVGAGLVLDFQAGLTNTGAATVAVSGGSTVAIKANGAALAAGAIRAGRYYRLLHNGTDFQLVALSDGLDALGSPGADRIVFWDHSALSHAHLTVGAGLSVSGTTITSTAGAPTITEYTTSGSSGTHTLAAGTRWIKVRMVAPGGGGGGASGAGAAAGNSTFGTVTAIGGSGGGVGNAFGGAGGTGGTGTLGTTLRFPGESGDGNTSSASGLPGARGGGTALFGGGGAASAGSGNAGRAGATNSGGGGGGASVSGGVGGAGGGGGESVEITISSPAASYSYAVGAGGAGGSGGTAGGAGAAGRIIIEEYA